MKREGSASLNDIEMILHGACSGERWQYFTPNPNEKNGVNNDCTGDGKNKHTFSPAIKGIKVENLTDKKVYRYIFYREPTEVTGKYKYYKYNVKSKVLTEYEVKTGKEDFKSIIEQIIKTGKE